MAGRVRRLRSPAVTPKANANAAYPTGAMPLSLKMPGSSRVPICAAAIGLLHQVTMRLSSPATAMLAAPATASLTASQRVRVTPWVHARRNVPVSNSRGRRFRSRPLTATRRSAAA